MYTNWVPLGSQAEKSIDVLILTEEHVNRVPGFTIRHSFVIYITVMALSELNMNLLFYVVFYLLLYEYNMSKGNL